MYYEKNFKLKEVYIISKLYGFGNFLKKAESNCGSILWIVKRGFNIRRNVMGERAETAVKKHDLGYNCCQAVACSFADKLGMDESTLYRVCEGFGMGMGNARGVCGAMSGAAVICGLLYSDGNTEAAGMTKAKTTKAAAAIQKKFVERAGALDCIDIKTGNDGRMFTSCENCIRIAAELVEEELGL